MLHYTGPPLYFSSGRGPWQCFTILGHHSTFPQKGDMTCLTLCRVITIDSHSFCLTHILPHTHLASHTYCLTHILPSPTPCLTPTPSHLASHTPCLTRTFPHSNLTSLEPFRTPTMSHHNLASLHAPCFTVPCPHPHLASPPSCHTPTSATQCQELCLNRTSGDPLPVHGLIFTISHSHLRAS